MLPIGGYYSFEKNLISNNPNWMSNVIMVQSARMALVYELQTREVKTIWLPYFYCDSVPILLKKLGYDLKFYTFDNDFKVILPKKFTKKDIIILVDYFGLTSKSLKKDMNNFQQKNIIIDASMSLWLQSNSRLPIFYSPRKFFGIPDGGFLKNPSKKYLLSECNSSLSKKRSSYLMLRKMGLIQQGRKAYSKAERSLSLDNKPMSISVYTKNLLLNVNFNLAYKSRRNNYSYLKKKLSKYGVRITSMPEKTAPLCLPIIHKNAQLIIKNLAKKNIFCPKYWPNIILPKNDFKGLELLNETVYIPIDQRYKKKDMNYIFDNLIKIL
tara:strand:- start:22450 stop:23424 length:975 start_codon:yes stop_codon:yes gene_type:complete